MHVEYVPEKSYKWVEYIVIATNAKVTIFATDYRPAINEYSGLRSSCQLTQFLGKHSNKARIISFTGGVVTLLCMRCIVA